MARAVRLTRRWGLLPPVVATSDSAGSIPSASATRSPGSAYCQLRGLTHPDRRRPGRAGPAGAAATGGTPRRSPPPPPGRPGPSGPRAPGAGIGRPRVGPGRLVTWPTPTMTGVRGSMLSADHRGRDRPSRAVPAATPRCPAPHGTLGTMRIAVGSDHAGYDLKTVLADHLADAGHEVLDLGTGSARRVGRLPRLRPGGGRGGGRRAGRAGVCVCGTGHRHRHRGQQGAGGAGRPGPRRDHGPPGPGAQRRQRGLPRGPDHRPAVAVDALDAFFATEYDGGRHQRRIDEIAAYESSGDRSRPDQPEPRKAAPTHDAAPRPPRRSTPGSTRRPRGRSACWARRRSARPTTLQLIASENFTSPGGAGRLGVDPHQQVRRGLPGPALLRRQPGHRRGRGPGPRAGRRRSSAPTTPTSSPTPGPTPTWPSTRRCSSRATPSWPCASTTAAT